MEGGRDGKVMLSELVLGHQREIFDRAKAAVARHFPTRAPSTDQIPEFLTGLVTALETDSERTGEASDSMRGAAIAHAQHQKTNGFSIDAIARTFGAVCDAITGMAVDLGVCLELRDVQLLNLCID